MTVNGVDLAGAPLWLAQDLGYYKQNHLNVSISVDGAESTDELVSGQKDIAFTSYAAALIPANKGMDTQIILPLSSMLISAYVVAIPSVKNISQCTTIATGPVGSGYYGASIQYQKIYNAKWDIVPYSDQPSMMAAVVGGHDNCGVVTRSLAASAVAAGKLHVLIDPENPATANPKFPQGVINASLVGMASNLSNKRSAVEEFMKAWHEAFVWEQKASPAQVAATLKSNRDPAWAAFTNATLISGLNYYKQLSGVDALTPALWNQSLEYQTNAGLTYVNTTDSKWSFANRIDASYYNEANGIPGSNFQAVTLGQ